MTTFALVHGAWHGAWCFQHLVGLLEGEGESAVAVDLPSDDVDATLGDYADLIVSSLEGTGDDVIVVGHSLNGMTIPLVAALRLVRRLVFVAAFVPTPGLSMNEQFSREPESFVPGADRGRDEDELGRTRWTDPRVAIELMYHDCDPAEAGAAVARLRPQAQGPPDEPSPLSSWPDVASDYVLCRDDRMTAPAWARHVARERLGVEPIEIPGGHSPMLSRPGHLAELLLGLARDPARRSARLS